MLGCAPDGIVAPPGLLTRPAQTKHSTCQRATGERTVALGQLPLDRAAPELVGELKNLRQYQTQIR